MPKELNAVSPTTDPNNYPVYPEAAAVSGVGQVAGSVAKAAVKGATGITLE